MTTMTTNQSAPITLRHELKHRIALWEDLVLSHRLQKLFVHDRYAGADGTYQITSLYFDTPYDSALREKLDGVNRREKFRLRYYGTDFSFIKLEKKFKINGLCGKRSVPITCDEAKRLLEGDISFLLESGKPLFIELYSNMQGKALRPKTIVRYDREAFFFAPGNVRITLDRNIRTALGSTAFLNPSCMFIPVSEQATVVEVKYDEFLPDIVRQAVQVPGRQALALSKYALCRRYD